MNSLSRPSTQQIAVALVLSALGTGVALAQSNPKGNMGAEPYGDARQMRSWCLSNTMGAARADCLEYSYPNTAEKNRSAQESQVTDFAGNALMRCSVFKGEDRVACDARVTGFGSTSGSVRGGGILKEVATVTRPDVTGVVTIEPKKP